nr:unnamed protein product [Digitaria exilis]
MCRGGRRDTGKRFLYMGVVAGEEAGEQERAGGAERGPRPGGAPGARWWRGCGVRTRRSEEGVERVRRWQGRRGGRGDGGAAEVEWMGRRSSADG